MYDLIVSDRLWLISSSQFHLNNDQNLNKAKIIHSKEHYIK